MAETDLQQTIIDNAQSAQEVTVDGTTTKARSLTELIAADKYMRGINAAKGTVLPVRITRINPGGAV